MGSYDYTCSVSNLPIGHGVPVKFLTLIESPHDPFNLSLFCLPISCKYNDYGSIENYDLNNIDVKLFLEMMKVYAVEKPLGENKYHDPLVSSDMSFDSWLSAMRSNAVGIHKESYSNSSFSNKKIDKNDLPGKKGKPTWERIQKQIELKGFIIGPNGYSANEVFHGCVKVKYNNYCKHDEGKEKLTLIKEALGEEYNTIFVPGEGSSVWSVEMLVFPHTNDNYDCDDPHSITYSFDIKDSLKIYQAIVREDVWNYLVNLKVKDYDILHSFDYYLNETNEFFPTLYKMKKLSKDDALEARMVINSSIIGRFEHKWLRKTSYIAAEILDKKEINSFINLMSETLKFNEALYFIRYKYRPGNSFGSQFGEFSHHLNFHKFLTKICKEKIKSESQKLD